MHRMTLVMPNLAHTYSSLIAWNSLDLLAALGILYGILALILVISGKVISEIASRPVPSHRCMTVRERVANIHCQPRRRGDHRVP